MGADNAGLRLDGQDITMQMLLDGVPIGDVPTEWETGSVSPKISSHEDKPMGADFDQLDQRLRGWTFRGSFFVRDLTIFRALMSIEEKRIARQAVPKLSVGFLLKKRVGGIEGFVLLGAVAKFSFDPGAAESRSKVTVDGMAEEYKET